MYILRHKHSMLEFFAQFKLIISRSVLNVEMKLLTLLNYLLVLCHIQAIGAVIVSPSGVASACSGDQLELMCTTSGSLLEWAFILTPDNAVARVYTKGLTTDTEAPEPLTINSTRFTFSRLSPPNRLPLISILVINPVTVGLNGTEVNCTDLETSETMSTIITTLTKDLIEDQSPEIEVKSTNKEQCKGDDGVTVTLEWTQANPLYMYHIDTVPQTSTFSESRNGSVTLGMSYNTLYNVSVSAEHLCGDSNVTIFTQLFYYASCENPVADITDENVTVLGYREPAVEGSKIFLICPTELELVGTRTSTCAANGQWKPDPREVNCKAEKEVDNQRLTNKTNKLTEVEKIALASVMVFIVVSIIFFTGGFLCRHYNNKVTHCYKERHPGVAETSTALPTTPAEDLHEDNDTRHVELELQANVAYENVPMN